MGRHGPLGGGRTGDYREAQNNECEESVNDKFCEVVITAPDADWLAAFTRTLVERRLAASGHNITPVRSIYRWRGEIHDRLEARVTLHTRRTLVARIAEVTQAEHPYEVPCV